MMELRGEHSHSTNSVANAPSASQLSHFNDSDTFCLYPFVNIDIRLRGRYGTCCRSIIDDKMTHLDSETPWNSKDFKRIRKDLWEGKKPKECQTCWDMEDAGAYSYRQETLHPQSAHRQWLYKLKEFNTETGHVGPGIPIVEVNFTNVCNLQCRMCNPEFSSTWEKDWKARSGLRKWFADNNQVNPSYEVPKFPQKKLAQDVIQFLKDTAPQIRYLKIVGGEPFLQIEHYQALEQLRPYAKDMILEYSTNLSTLSLGSHHVFDHWEHFKEVHLMVSIDGPPGLYEYVRRGGDIKALEENVKTIHRFIEEKGLQKKVFLKSSCTFSVYNVGQAMQTALYITSLGLKFHSSQVETPSFLNSQLLPNVIKKSITRNVERDLKNLDKILKPYWEKHPRWKSEFMRKYQTESIQTYVKNSLLHMNATDKSSEFPEFLSFEKEFNKDWQKDSIFKFYPTWKALLLKARIQKFFGF